MSIFQEIEKTKEDYIKESQQAIAKMNIDLLQRMKRTYNNAISFIFESEHYTPQEILDAYSSAAQFFLAAQTLLATIKSFDPDFVPVEIQHQYTINEDGTVTIGGHADENDLPDDII